MTTLNVPNYYTFASIYDNIFNRWNHNGDIIHLEVPQNSLATAHMGNF